jgi:hypothetical protein
MSMIVILTANFGFSDLTPLTPGLPLAYAVLLTNGGSTVEVIELWASLHEKCASMKQATLIDIECLSLIRSMRFVNQARTHKAPFTNSTPFEMPQVHSGRTRNIAAFEQSTADLS